MAADGHTPPTNGGTTGHSPSTTNVPVPLHRPSLSSRLGEMLVRRSIITAEQLAEASIEQRKNGGHFAATLVRLGIVSEDDLCSYLHKEYRLPVIDPMSVEPTAEVLGLIPHT